MAPPELIAFRLPVPVVRRAFALHTSVIVAVLTLFHVLARQPSIEPLVGAAVLAALVLAIAYAATARRIWVSLSASGLSAFGYFGKKLDIPWTAPVRVSASRRSGQKGHAVVAVQNAGLIASGTHAIFIPAAISTSPEFAAAVAAWAPAAHPLRSITKSAA